MREGKNREIRNVLGHLGLAVNRLIRVSYGPFQLGDLPDGAVEHLIWLRNYREEWTRTYRFRDPVRLPKGTRIVVDATAPGAAVISLQ
jgi:uncharacterized protein with LGFP repeats